MVGPTSAPAPPAETKHAEALPKIGALCLQRVRCGKPGCRCARGELHGPYAYLFWREGGRLRKRYVRRERVAAVVALIAERRREAWMWRGAVAGAGRRHAELRAWLREVEAHG
jgi:hypothetical protein